MGGSSRARAAASGPLAKGRALLGRHRGGSRRRGRQDDPPMALPAAEIGMLLHHQGIAKAIEALEPLLATAGRLASLLTRQDWELAQVEEAISLDQALTPRLLALANSALMARGREIATVRDAVVRLGAQHVVQVAMSVAVRKRFAVALPSYGLATGQLWNHGVAA